MVGKQPIYRTDSVPSRFQAEMNTGLWYDKFCNEWKSDWSGLIEEDKRRNIEDGKKNWITTVTQGSIGDAVKLSETIERREQLLDSCDGKALFFKTTGPFVTGLGREHPVENGFAWHHTLGTPYLPGSSVKGMVRNWAEQWEDTDQKTIDRVFGPRSKSDTDASVGSVIFMDALPTVPIQLKADVMTPHYGPYYQDDSGNTPPADWHNPIPIPFLVVDEGQEFLFGIIPRNPENDPDKKDCELVKKWLLAALRHIGAGAKTAVGYGRFENIVKLSKEEEWLKVHTQGHNPKIIFAEWEKLNDRAMKMKLAKLIPKKMYSKKLNKKYAEYLDNHGK